MTMNNALTYLVIFATAWKQMVSALKQYQHLPLFAVLSVTPVMAQSDSQPTWMNDLSQLSVAGVDGNLIVYRELLRELTLEAVSITGLAMPKALPPVVLADKETVARYACAGKCRAAGAYHPRYGVALDRSLDPLNDDLARSILLHELVHYLQYENQLYADKTDCARWFKREEHAYSAQQQYLRKVQSTSHVAISLNNPCEAGAS